MSDYNSSLPVRTESAGDVIAKIADKNTPSQQLAVGSDGSINVTDNGGSLTVDGSVTVSATDLDIRDLTSASDSVEVLQNTHDDLNANANIQVGNADVANGNPVPVSDAGGSLTVDASDLDIRDLTSASDSVEVLQAAHDDLNANANIQVGNADVANGNPVPVSDAGGSITVDAVDLDIRDLDAATDSVQANLFDEAGVAFSVSNPLPVSVSVSDGDPIHSYDTQAALAAAASDNHDYTVTALKTLYVRQIVASGSGKMKIEIQEETAAGAGTYNTIAVFFNSTASPNMYFQPEQPLEVEAGKKIRVIRTNRDNQAQDVFSTIIGAEF